jgi:hypothetical protein
MALRRGLKFVSIVAQIVVCQNIGGEFGRKALTRIQRKYFGARKRFLPLLFGVVDQIFEAVHAAFDGDAKAFFLAQNQVGNERAALDEFGINRAVDLARQPARCGAKTACRGRARDRSNRRAG